MSNLSQRNKYTILNVPSQNASRPDINVPVETGVRNALQMLGSVLLMTTRGTYGLRTNGYWITMEQLTR